MENDEPYTDPLEKLKLLVCTVNFAKGRPEFFDKSMGKLGFDTYAKEYLKWAPPVAEADIYDFMRGSDADWWLTYERGLNQPQSWWALWTSAHPAPYRLPARVAERLSRMLNKEKSVTWS